jgi:HEAT repeat protein
VAGSGAAAWVRGLGALLRGEAVERQIAAAIVAGELGIRDPEIVNGLCALTASGVAPLQLHAAEALGRLGTKRALPALLPLLASRDEGVRRAAAAAVGEFGPAALPALEARLAAAGVDAGERHALEEALARLGGKEALAALLAGIGGDDVEAARAAALAARPRIKGADARDRRAYLSEVKRFLAR